jgi:hypothetical protein
MGARGGEPCACDGAEMRATTAPPVIATAPSPTAAVRVTDRERRVRPIAEQPPERVEPRAAGQHRRAALDLRAQRAPGAREKRADGRRLSSRLSASSS